MMMRKVVGGAFACLVMSGSVFAQVSPREAKKIEEAAHLVGHEDAALLERIAGGIEEWDPRNLESPYLKRIQTAEGPRWEIRRPDLLEFIADPDAAVVLGKALFWEMAAGSDFKAQASGDAIGTACASCHYRFGADARNRNTSAIAFPAWEKFATERNLQAKPNDYRTPRAAFTQRALKYTPNGEPLDARMFRWSRDPDPKATNLSEYSFGINGLLPHEILGSQGVVRSRFDGFGTDGFEKKTDIDPVGPSAAVNMFIVDGQRSRQVTARNSPSVINAVMNDRQFHDGRAESTFNGFSIFGDFDKRVALKRAILDGENKATKFVPVSVAIVRASLGSQAVGPIVNEVEMSYVGRSFHDVAYKLLERQALSAQAVSQTDSVLGKYTCAGNPGLFDNGNVNAPLKYRQLIRKAFRKEWWGNEVGITQGNALKSRLEKERKKFEKLFEGYLAANPNLPLGEVRTRSENIQRILEQRELVFPARGIANELEPIYKIPKEGKQESEALYKALQPLIDAIEEWTLVEAEILPLREYNDDDYDTNKSRLILHEMLAKMTSAEDGNLLIKDDLMNNNFSLFWGLSIMLYESTLISNDSPFDQMLRGNSEGIEGVWKDVTSGQDTITLNKNVITPPQPELDESVRKIRLDKLPKGSGDPVLSATAMFQRGMRVFVTNCGDCHEAPYFTSVGELELAPELPAPIAKLHEHSLVRTSWADAFKQKMLEHSGVPKKPNLGVTDEVRPHLGNRAFFTDLERIPVIQDAVAELMVEYMPIPDRPPTAFDTQAGVPGRLAPPRVPMITWFGTRPLLSFAPTRRVDEKKKFDPYVFYDVGFYALGISDPRYDWGVWGFSGTEFDLTHDKIDAAVKTERNRIIAMALSADDQGRRIELLNARASELRKAIGSENTVAAEKNKLTNTTAGRKAFVGSDLGSAYRLKRQGAEFINRPKANLDALQELLEGGNDQETVVAADHTIDRNYLDPTHERDDVHFFSRGRRMVMSRESWGHRKPFIEDNELMGWGAFKTPSLRNVALTAPYMHNGRFLTLRQVLDFYQFDNPDLIPAHAVYNPDLHPEMGRLLLNPDGKVGQAADAPVSLLQVQDSESLLFFLLCLTDDRVKFERAPFDHPSVRIVNGFEGNKPSDEHWITIGEVGASGRDVAPSRFPAGD